MPRCRKSSKVADIGSPKLHGAAQSVFCFFFSFFLLLRHNITLQSRSWLGDLIAWKPCERFVYLQSSSSATGVSFCLIVFTVLVFYYTQLHLRITVWFSWKGLMRSTLEVRSRSEETGSLVFAARSAAGLRLWKPSKCFATHVYLFVFFTLALFRWVPQLMVLFDPFISSGFVCFIWFLAGAAINCKTQHDMIVLLRLFWQFYSLSLLRTFLLMNSCQRIARVDNCNCVVWFKGEYYSLFHNSLLLHCLCARANM